MRTFLPILFLAALSSPAWTQEKPIPDERRLVFTSKEASLEAILRYVSSVTGWIFVLEKPCSGTITAVSDTEVPLDRCLDFLNAALRNHGLAIVNPLAPAVPRKGQTLRVVTTDSARVRAEIFIGADEDAIPPSDQFRTQVIPLKAASVVEVEKELRETLRTLLGEAGQIALSTYSNSLILTGRSDAIRRAVRLLQAIDVDAPTEIQISLFPLQNADAPEIARTLNEFFRKETAKEDSRLTLAPLAGMLRAARNPGQRPEGDGGAASSSTGGSLSRESVRITPDARTNSLLVYATLEKTRTIERLLSRLDVTSSQAVEVKIYKLTNADAAAMTAVLESVFHPRSTPTPSPRASSPASPDRTRDGTGLRLAGSAPSTPPEATIPGQEFEATPDTRTRSVIVRASHACLGIVDAVVAKLDGDTTESLGIYVHRLRHADAASTAVLIQSLLKDGPSGSPAPSGRGANGTAPYNGMQPLAPTPPAGTSGNSSRTGSPVAPRPGN